jgi:hypothetical protein
MPKQSDGWCRGFRAITALALLQFAAQATSTGIGDVEFS